MTVAQQDVATGASAAAVVDRPDAEAKKALAASVAGYAMDGFDLLILGFMLGAIRADLSLTPAQRRLAAYPDADWRGRRPSDVKIASTIRVRREPGGGHIH
jgi:hypothetical protein